MPAPAIFRSTSPEVLEAHRTNITEGRAAATRWRHFMDTTGLEPAITYHPDGALAEGAYPLGGTLPTPPSGWVWDPARNILIPGRADAGHASNRARALLASLDWVYTPTPGIDRARASITIRHVSGTAALNSEALASIQGHRNTILELDGEVWLIIPSTMAHAISPDHWERSRRYLLESALTRRVKALTIA